MKKKLQINKVIGYSTLNKVWHNLLKELPNEYHNMNLSIATQNWPDYELQKGGYATSCTITIGRKFLDKNKRNIYGLLAMLAHELGHHVLGHIHSYSEKKEQEQDADQFGLFLAMKAGYSGKLYVEASKQFEKWRSTGIQKSHKKSHGDADDRIEKLTKQLKYLGAIK